MNRAIMPMLMLMLILIVACGNNPDAAPGNSNQERVSPASAPTDAPAPLVNAVRHGQGWRISVLVPRRVSQEFWIKSISIVDPTSKKTLSCEFEPVQGDPMNHTYKASFDLATLATLAGDVAISVRDNQGQVLEFSRTFE